jgi:hypothetical protein
MKQKIVTFVAGVIAAALLAFGSIQVAPEQVKEVLCIALVKTEYACIEAPVVPVEEVVETE